LAPSLSKTAKEARGLEMPAATLVGIRWLSLALVAACGLVFDFPAATARVPFGALIVAALLSAVPLLARARDPIPAFALTAARITLWTVVLAVTRDARSPAVVALLLEVPLAGLAHGKRAVPVAAVVVTAALVWAATHSASWNAALATVLAGVGVLSYGMVDRLERQRMALETSHRLLRSRADHLREELRLLGDFMTSGLVTLDPLGRIVACNRAAASLLGVAPEGLGGRPWQEVLRLRSGHEALTALLDRGDPVRGERMLIEDAEGRPLDVRMDAWLGVAEDGPRVFLLIEPAVADDKSAADPLRRLGEAAACVSHQIRHALHSVRALALESFAPDAGPARAAGAPAPPDARTAREEFLSALDVLRELTDDVLAMGGGPRPAASDLPLLPLLARAIAWSRRPSVTIHMVSAPPCPRVAANHGRLVHALYNVIDNACRASAPGGVVEVVVSEDERSVTVDILDSGAGFAATVEPSPRGHGIGVLAARRFLDSFGAGLEYVPRAEGGTSCRVLLPRAVGAD
jgi:signal transduction histidine kinase